MLARNRTIERRSGQTLLIILIALLGACSDVPRGSDGSEYTTAPAARDAVREATAALAEGNVGLAVAKIEDAAVLDRESPEVLLAQGEIMMRAERLEEARYALETLVGTYPRYAGAWMKLGNVALRQRQYPEAVAHYETEIAVKPTPAAWYNLSLAHAEMDEPDAAREALEEAIRLDPKYSNAYAALADLAESDGDFETALSYARKAYENRPSDDRLREKVGFMMLRTGQAAEALPLLQQVVEREPWDYQARYNLGQALQRVGQTDQARAQLQRAEADREGQAHLRRLERSIRMDPTNGQLHFALGIQYQKWGRLDDALRSYRVAKQILPDNLQIDVNIATVYLHREDLEKARLGFQRVIEQDSTVAAAWLNLGFLDARSGEDDAAAAAWSRAVAIEPAYRAAVEAFQQRRLATR